MRGFAQKSMGWRVPTQGHQARQQKATRPLYLDGNEPNDEGQKDCFFAIPALFAIHFYFALQFPPLPAILHENLG